MSAAPPRNHGLDTLRAIAIALVFMYHYMVFVSRENTFGWLSVVGWVGVDLFFVLSGYLIADQVLAGTSRGETLSLKAFYARRALRTLPNYWFVLALYFLFPAVMGGRPPPLWSFLTFTQNFGLQPGTAFSHAWSLCIEEQFYLALPLVVLAAVRWGKSRAQAWWLVGGFIAFGVAARSLLWLSYGRAADGQLAGYHPHIYYATLCRFDEFLPGVAVAMLKHLHPAVWQKLQRHGHQLLLAGVVATAALLTLAYHVYFIEGYGYGFVMTAFGYSLIAICFAVLMLAALSPQSWLHRVRVPAARSLALWSYAIYLTHKPVAHILWRELLSRGWKASAPATVLVITSACLVGGWLTYRLIETPFMRWRARHVPSNFAGGRASREAAAGSSA